MLLFGSYAGGYVTMEINTADAATPEALDCDLV